MIPCNFGMAYRAKELKVEGGVVYLRQSLNWMDWCKKTKVK